MRTFDLIMYVLAGACFLFAAIGGSHPRINFVALGLLFWVIVPLNELVHSTS